VYAFETNGWDVNYQGEFLNVLGRWDVLARAELQGPLYTRNYFGLGNNSTYWLDNDENEETFIRMREQLYGAYPALRRRFNDNVSISFGGTIEAIQIEDTQERFVRSNNPETPEIRPAVFDGQAFAGGEFQLNFLNADNPVNPTQGLRFNATAGWKTNLAETGRSFGYFGGSLGFYFGNNRAVLASHVGARHVVGDYEFYQAPTLGARTNLRGYRNERFAGQTAFFHQNDLRIKLFVVNNYIMPFTLGLLGGYDYGRVWSDAPGETGGMHSAYGGGFWLSPFDLAVLNFSLFKSDDGLRFEFRGRFAF
jgi:outer membrane protein assembly factor BamA